MTTGNIQSGSLTGPFYFQKIWLGVDGFTSNPITVAQRFFVRFVSVPRHVEYTVVKTIDSEGIARFRNKKRVVPAVISQFPVERIRHFRPKVFRSDHAYDITVKSAVNTKGTDPTYGSYLSVLPSFDTGTYVWNSNDELQLINKLSSSVKGHQFQLGVALAEGKKSVELLNVTVTRILGAVRAVKKGRLDLALRHLGAVPKGNHGKRVVRPHSLASNDVSKMWLEIQYGWRPLISDVHESFKAYSALTDKNRRTRFMATHSKKTTIVSYPNGTWHSKVEQNIVLSKQVIYVATEVLSQPRSLGLADPLSIAWELVPFSFVADWFIPIGTYLEALHAVPRLTGSFCVTYRSIVKGKGTGILWPNFSGAKYSSQFKSVSRTTPTLLAVPRPEFKPIGDALSLGHVKNSLALLHVAFS